MSTEIPDRFMTNSSLRVHDWGEVVNVSSSEGATRTVVTVSRAALLSAVEAELKVRLVPADSIVIDRAELPPMTLHPGGMAVVSSIGGIYRVDDWPGARETALALLALAEHLDAHPPKPPVDEAMVSAIAAAVRDAMGITEETVAAGHIRPGNSADLARRLYLAGVRIEARP